jgi:hypothetical protein
MSTVQTAKRKAVKVKIADLIIDVFVREKTDPEYVFHLATLYEAGVEMEPIEITRSMHVIEGRHRIEAANLADLKETKADIIVALEAMVRAGASEKWIREQIPFPRSVIEIYLQEVRTNIQNQKLSEAREMLAQGFTVDQAAEKLGLTVESIQTRILKQKSAKPNNYNLALRKSLALRNRKAGQANRQVFDAAIRNWKDGELSKDAVMDVISAVENHGMLSVKAAEDARKRFFQMIS